MFMIGHLTCLPIINFSNNNNDSNNNSNNDNNAMYTSYKLLAVATIWVLYFVW